MLFNEMVNRIRSWDYNPIFDTDFASLVRYDRFPSLLYGSGATLSKIGLWYGAPASLFIPIFSVYIICPTRFFCLVRFSILRQSSLVKFLVRIKNKDHWSVFWGRSWKANSNQNDRHTRRRKLRRHSTKCRGQNKQMSCLTIKICICWLPGRCSPKQNQLFI